MFSKIKDTNSKDIINYLISFTLAFLSIIIIFVFNKMLFGEYLVLRSDLLDGISLYKGVSRDILNGNNPLFTYNVGLGTNNALSLAFSYYSPFNLLYILFYNANVSFITAIIIALKIGFTSLFFYILSINYFNKNSFLSILFSVFYSTCSFNLAYGTIHIYWLDAVMILPLLIYSIINCIEHNKRVLMIILYTYLFISCFYMGYIVGIFTFIFVLLYLLLLYKKKSEKVIEEKIKIFVNWFIGTGISVFISSIVWAPALFFLLANRAEDSTSVINLLTPVTFKINSLFWGVSSGISGVYGYIYCGIPALILTPLFFLNKKIENKEKIFYGSILVFYFLGMSLPFLNMFLHAMDQPDFFWYRYSYIISFVLCLISVRQLDNIESDRIKLPFVVISFWIIFYIFVQHTIDLWIIPDIEYSTNTNQGMFYNACFMFAWVSIGVGLIKCSKKKIIYIVSVLLLIFEITSNSFNFLVYKEYKNSYENLDNYMDENLDAIKNSGENGLYRTIVNNTQDFARGYYYGYNDFSYFGSQEKYDVRRFLSNIGFSTATRVALSNGHSPVSDMLMGVKYYIDCPDELYDSDSVIDSFPIDYYKNDYSLSIGYLVSGETILFEFEDRNVFDNMNDLVNTLSGINSDCFIRVQDSDIYYDFDSMEKQIDNDGEVVFSRLSDIGKVVITVPSEKYVDPYVQFQIDKPIYKGDEFEVVFADNYSNNAMDGVAFSCSNKMSCNDEKGYYYLTLYSDDSKLDSFSCKSVNIYSIDYNSLIKQYDELSKNQLKITSWSNGHIKGIMDVNGDKRLMLLTIPYDPGWTAHINGTEVEVVRLLEGAFMGVYLPKEGEYEISFDYDVPGLKVGMCVSLCGILAFLSVIFEKQLKKKK